MSDLSDISNKHVVVLINYMRRHHVLAFTEFAKRVGKLTILVSTPMEGDRDWKPQWDGLNVIIQKNHTITLNRSSGFDEKNFIHLPWDTTGQLRSLKPDLILSYEMGMRTLLCAGFRTLNRRAPLVVVGNMSSHLESRRGILRKTLRKGLTSFVDYFTYNGPSCRRYLKRLGIDDSKLIYLPYCYDNQKAYDGAKEPNETGLKRLLFCGALSERKAILPFTKLLNKYCTNRPNVNCEFTIAGDGPYRDQVAGLARTNLCIELLGNCDSEQLRDCYRDTDICVFPSLGDEWGMVPMEAWASGVPVLGSKYAQSVETVGRHGENGWIFDSLSESDTCLAIDEAFGTSPERILAMGKNGRESARMFDASQSADQLCEVVDRALYSRISSSAKTNVASIRTTSYASKMTASKNYNFDNEREKMSAKPLATMSLDLDNKWAYLRSHNDSAWESFPSYLDLVVPRILKTLDDLDLKTTFFVVGQDAAIEANHKALASIADAGHEIANHSFNHEPCLHLYTPAQLELEFETSEAAIKKATGKKTVGFRGPGFSLSDQTLEVLLKRGYQYDCTTFPTFLSPLARAYYFMSGSFTKKQVREREALFGKFSDGFLPNDAFLWNSDNRNLLELPVTTFPVIKTPLHATYLHYLASFSAFTAKSYFAAALSAYRLVNTVPSFLLHPLDFMGAEDAPDLNFFPGMKVPSDVKMDRIYQYLQMYREQFNVVTMQTFAEMSLSGQLDKRSVALARTGVT